MTFADDTSVSETYRFIKEFEFIPSIGINPHAALTFSDTTLIRLCSDYNVRLRRQQTNNLFPTDSDIWFMTWVSNPKALRKLLMVQVFSKEPTYTFTQIRLFDGTDHYFWDDTGVGEWAVATDDDWNTEAVINAHIEDFPIIPDRRFAVVVNLATTDPYVTPSVREIRVLMEIRIDYIEDLLFRSLIPLLKSEIKPLGNYTLPALIEAATTIDLDEYQLDTNFNVVDVDAVFDFTNDSELLYNLLDSYNSSTKVITLTEEIDVGSVPWIIFRYSPVISYTTNQDYIEVAKIPALVIQQLEVPLASAYNLSAREGIVDKGTGDGVLVYEPFRATMEFRLHGHADNAVDLQRLKSAVMNFFENNQRIRSVGLDEYYTMQLVRELRDLVAPNRADELIFWTRFNIMNVRMPFKSEDRAGIRRLLLTFKEPVPPHEDPLKGGSRVIVTAHEEDGAVSWSETFEITK